MHGYSSTSRHLFFVLSDVPVPQKSRSKQEMKLQTSLDTGHCAQESDGDAVGAERFYAIVSNNLTLF